MARAFTTNQQISGTTTVAKNLANFSIARWARRPTSGSIQFLGFNELRTERIVLSHFSDNRIYCTISNGSNSAGFVSKNVTGWHHACIVFNGNESGNTNRLKFYFDGVAQTLSFSGTIPATTSNTSDVEQFRVGRAQLDNAWSTGDFAEIGMWQASLTAEEVASLAKGMTCDKIRPQSLVTYIPLVRDIQDLARGMTLTDTNSTVANHPRVYA